jgi:hypothetical protein
VTDRKTASTITDIELDQLYDQLAALREVSRGYCPHCGRGDCTPDVDAYEQQRAGRVRAEAALARTRALHCEEYGCCAECTNSHAVLWPCPTIRALDEKQ